MSVVVLVAVMPAAARAQTSAARPAIPSREGVHIALNAGIRTGGDPLRDRMTLEEYAEEGQLNVEYAGRAGVAFDINGGVLFTRMLGIGGGVTLFEDRASAQVRAEVPHPFFFEQHRSVDGQTGRLHRQELTLHVHARGVLPLTRRTQVTVFGGPSLFRLRHDLVRRVQFSEVYPYDSATYAGVETVRADGTALGFHGGADVGVFITRRVGVGIGVQYTRGSVPLSAGATRTVTVRAGGLQSAAGLRLRF